MVQIAVQYSTGNGRMCFVCLYLSTNKVSRLRLKNGLRLRVDRYLGGCCKLRDFDWVESVFMGVPRGYLETRHHCIS